MNYYEMLLARKLAKGELPPNAYLLKTASGSLVSFSDGADLPMPSFICDIDAVQDLHGYDAPWVGGAGKNKAESVVNDWSNKGITATKNDDGSYSITGTATEDVTSNFLINVYPVSAGENYIVTNKKNQTDTATKYSRCVLSFYNDSTYKSEINVNEGQTITVPSNANRLRLSYVWNNGFVVPAGAIIYPMLRLATETDATFAPYSNICPISGHTGVDAVISPTTEASAGTTIAVSWQTEAGEVFGGYIDLVSGLLTVTHKEITYDGVTSGKMFTNKGGGSDNNYYMSCYDGYLFDGETDYNWVNNNAMRNRGLINSHYGYAETSTSIGFRAYIGNNGTALQPRLQFGAYSDITTIELANQWLAEQYTNGTPWQVKYPLATPQTYQLTPTQIKSLLGNNNAWCDTGDVTLEYFGKGAE